MIMGHGRTTVHLLVLVAVSLLFTWPLFVYGLPDLSHDGIEHARWVKNFSLQFWQGELYPRWLSETNGGLGSPSFFIYPPLASYAATVFQPFLILKDPEGWLIAGWSAALAGILSTIAAYFWLRDFTSSLAALFGAVIYTVSPYHLAIDLYNRGALAEYWAFVWMPLVLLCVHQCVLNRPLAVPGLALSYGLLAFTHLPTVVPG